MNKSFILILIAVVVLSGGVILGYALGLPQLSAPRPDEDMLQTPTAAPLAESRTGKDILTCRELEDAVGTVFTDTIALPSQFPPEPEFAQYCGGIVDTGAYYFIADEEDKIILDYYKNPLERSRCTSTGAQQAPQDRVYSYLLPYECAFASGVVAVYKEVAAYVVTVQ